MILRRPFTRFEPAAAAPYGGTRIAEAMDACWTRTGSPSSALPEAGSAGSAAAEILALLDRDEPGVAAPDRRRRIGASSLPAERRT